MAQIWLTYEELADFTKRSPSDARDAVIVSAWTRRRCRDGLTRVKLPAHAATLYMAHSLLAAAETVGADDMVDDMVAALRAAFTASRPGAAPRLRLVAA